MRPDAMKAVVAIEVKDSREEDFLCEMELPIPAPGAGELLVQVKAIAFNPVDYKRRQNTEFLAQGPRILGWDASGIVRELGSGVTDFNVGDEVFYSGELLKPGCNAEFQSVDARLVGKKPRTLSFAQAASLPLTSVTAWEALFEKLKIPSLSPEKTVLVIGGAGGVGSIAIQLLRQLTRCRIFATASREESSNWCMRMGAHAIIDRQKDLASEIRKLGCSSVDYCFATSGSKQYAPQLLEVLAPFSELCIIDDPEELDLFPFKYKSISIHWELMFTKSLFNFRREEQGRILHQISALVDEGRIQSTVGTHLKGLSAETIMHAHRLLESGTSVGKIVAEY